MVRTASAFCRASAISVDHLYRIRKLQAPEDEQHPQGLRIDSIIHKATIDVDEKGTVATAATALLTRSLRAIPFPVFRADHPFLFLLRDVNAGIILFIGKLMVPIGPTRKRNTYISSIKTLAARFWGR